MAASTAQVLERETVLSLQDGSPVEIINPYGDSQIVLVCEHASNLVPARLDNLGLTLDQRSACQPFYSSMQMPFANALMRPLLTSGSTVGLMVCVPMSMSSIHPWAFQEL